VDPTGSTIINWNNKPASGWTAADDEWAYGSVHRSELLEDAVARRTTHSLGSLVAAMNRAATQDLRNAEGLPAITAVLQTGPAPSPREQQMLALLEQWRTEGSSRLDRDLDGRIDAPGAAIMDAAWPWIADAVMSPVLGQPGQRPGLIVWEWLVRLCRQGPADPARPARGGGVQDALLRAGDLTACRTSLWQALKDAGDTLAAAQGSNDPTQWRSGATAERIRFLPNFPITCAGPIDRPSSRQSPTADTARHQGRWPRPQLIYVASLRQRRAPGA